jgi:hypothetical protein
MGNAATSEFDEGRELTDLGRMGLAQPDNVAAVATRQMDKPRSAKDIPYELR